MKKVLILILINTYIFASNHLFLVNKYDKELELEAKIISKIATSIFSKNNSEIKIFIPNITKDETEIYSSIFKLSNESQSDFIFEKREYHSLNKKDKLYFTNNYRNLISNSKFIGAFFWSKSRPNIVFIKNRLEEKEITLPKSYEQFIEDF